MKKIKMIKFRLRLLQ